MKWYTCYINIIENNRPILLETVNTNKQLTRHWGSCRQMHAINKIADILII
jgi:hypothetical protein